MEKDKNLENNNLNKKNKDGEKRKERDGTCTCVFMWCGEIEIHVFNYCWEYIYSILVLSFNAY